MDTITGLATDERTARIALAVLVAIDDPVTGRLLGLVGAVETVRLLMTDGPVPTMDRTAAALWRRHMRTDASVEVVRAAMTTTDTLGFGTLIPGDTDFPASLGDLGDRTPYVLWTKGTTSLLAGPLHDRFTITGARACTNYGTQVTQMLASELAYEEKVLVSDGGFGIGAVVHSVTLAIGGDTVAVLGGGLDCPHPIAHRELLERIGDRGLLVSEIPPGSVPTYARFLARTRIEAALSGSITIVEAAPRSLASPAAQCAHDLGRPVGAVPGPVTSATSIGTHRLLQTGIASLVTDAADLMRLVDRPPAAYRFHLAIRYADRPTRGGRDLPSIGTVRHSYDNAMTDSVIGSTRPSASAVMPRSGPVDEPELAALIWVDWFNTGRPLLDRLRPTSGGLPSTPQEPVDQPVPGDPPSSKPGAVGNRSQHFTGVWVDEIAVLVDES